MSETLDRLVYMANQIARNLATQADAEAMIADHIDKFWDPRMKTMIFGYLAEGGRGLAPASAAAVHRLMISGSPPPQSGATVFGAAGGSDAG